MKDHLRFSVVYWHTFRNGGQDPFGIDATIDRPWDDNSNSVENALTRIDAAFEFFTKLNNPQQCFHDIDAAPEGATLKETEDILKTITAKLKSKQAETGVKLLWCTQNMFSHPRFMNGASTNPDIDVFMWACAKTKMALDCSHELGAENHVFWGGREGQQSVLNTNIRHELDQMAAFLKMARDYKQKMG